MIEILAPGVNEFTQQDFTPVPARPVFLLIFSDEVGKCEKRLFAVGRPVDTLPPAKSRRCYLKLLGPFRTSAAFGRCKGGHYGVRLEKGNYPTLSLFFVQTTKRAGVRRRSLVQNGV